VIVWLGSVRGIAHPQLQDSWWAVVETNRMITRVSVTFREIVVVQPSLFGTNQSVDFETLQRGLTNHAAYLVNVLEVRGDEKVLTGEVLDWAIQSEAGNEESPDSPLYLDRSHVTFDIEYRFSGLRLPKRVSFRQSTLSGHPYAPGIPWEVTYALMVRDSNRREIGSGVLVPDTPYAVLIPGTFPANQDTKGVAADNRLSVTDEAPASAWNQDFRRFLEYFELGVHHIFGGYDHLLFLAALALGARRLVNLFSLVAAFTLAHSLTVTLSALDLFRLPSWFVEPFIAASILFIAVENIFFPSQTGTRGRLALTFGFGLVHGLGFAGGLNDSLRAVGGSGVGWAIAAFCVGIEMGHLSLGLPFWITLQAGKKFWGPKFGAGALRFGSAIVSLGGGYFFVSAIRQYFG
jgi:hydrogenase/urease accessory protein HupE